MAGLRRTERSTRIIHNGTSVDLVEAAWILTMGSGKRAGGFSYTAPIAIAVGGRRRITIRDHVMLARIGAVVLTCILILRAVTMTRANNQSKEVR